MSNNYECIKCNAWHSDPIKALNCNHRGQLKTMTKLSEIEECWKAFKHWNEKNPISRYEDSAGPDVEWLINRVKELEKALFDLVKSDVIKTAQFITYSEAYSNARKALKE